MGHKERNRQDRNQIRCGVDQTPGELKEKEGDYYLQILDIDTVTHWAKLLIETGKGSFRLSNVFAAGDWVIITDTQIACWFTH
jgi:hypothetical protein